MNAPMKLTAYAAGLAVIFGGALVVGAAMDPGGPSTAAHGHTPAPSPDGGLEIPGGLQVSEAGYTLTPSTTDLPAGETTDFRFTVTGPDGTPVTGFQVRHDKKLHLIVVPRDLSGFQHLHPALAADGTWSVKLAVPRAGAYRMYADFAPDDAEPLTLGTDLFAQGPYEPEALPEPARTATVDGYTVTLDGEPTPGESSRLTLKVSKDGRPVTDLQPYLGSYGHLVALRAGDLAYLHVHPDGEPGDGKTAPGPGITFHTEVPSRGTYRLYLDFQHAGTVRTAAFTVTVTARTTTAPGTADPAEHGH
ncbi:hypothetical protein [Sphaerisporangium aureirubrum]|uniref:Secreted protein n=1 Tax=Sphaerisporangium aureirubrum TaxID=1544736 RepID=A0ABW1NC46_9ACTN